MPRIQDIGAFSAVREAGLAKLVPAVPRIAIGMGTCGRGNGAEGLYHAFADAIERNGMPASLPAWDALDPASRNLWPIFVCRAFRW
jgi:NADH-quinone oxidoreductase subunit F